MISLPYTIITPTIMQLIVALNDIHPALGVFAFIVLIIIAYFLMRALFKAGD